MKYIRQLLYDMRHQKMMTLVAISGTAVSIFLVMVVFMVNNLNTVEIAPDINRQRIYAGMHITMKSTNPEMAMMSMGPFSYGLAQRLFEGLEGVELLSYCGESANVTDILRKGEVPVNVSVKLTDGDFWKMFSFKFLEGKPFTEEECLANTDKIVITESLARRLFSSLDVVGRELFIRQVKYVIGGVVEDVNPILQNAWSEVYIPIVEDMRQPFGGIDTMFGSFMVLMLYKEDADPAAIKQEVKSRYATLNAELEKDEREVVYNEVPYNAEELVLPDAGYAGPDAEQHRRARYIIYALLILLPAINLSSMMHGRLQHRISEIGVRRAYGAKRMDIIFQLIGENFVVTVAGAVIGVVLSYLFMSFLSSEFFMFVNDDRVSALDAKMATPEFSMLFTWSAFFIAVGACFILNLLTATVPAWRASMMEPAVAISKSRN